MRHHGINLDFKGMHMAEKYILDTDTTTGNGGVKELKRYRDRH